MDCCFTPTTLFLHHFVSYTSIEFGHWHTYWSFYPILRAKQAFTGKISPDVSLAFFTSELNCNNVRAKGTRLADDRGTKMDK